LAFYGVRHDQPWQAARFLSLGLGWAVATLALFTTTAGRGVDQRLRVTGARAGQVLCGRMLAMVGCGLVLVIADGLLVTWDQDLRRPWAFWLLMVTTVLIAAPLGALVGAFLPRELEGALALLIVLAMQMMADPAGATARVLPFWSTRELGTYALDPTGDDYLWRGLAHFGVTWVLLAGAAAVVTGYRLRLVRLPLPE